MHYMAIHPGDVLDRLMRENGNMTASALHRATGVTQPTIFRLINKITRDPSRETLLPIAKYFAIDPEDFYKDPKAAASKARPVNPEIARIAREISELSPRFQKSLIEQVDSLLRTYRSL